MEREKYLIKELSQQIVDLSALFLPVSGFSMIASVNVANKACEEMGIEFESKPNGKYIQAMCGYRDNFNRMVLNHLKEMNEFLGIEFDVNTSDESIDNNFKKIRSYLNKQIAL